MRLFFNFVPQTIAMITLASSLHSDSPIADEKTTQSRSDAALDSQLVQRFLGGDESGFIKIMDRHRLKIFNAAFSFLHNHADAEEIAQDTFIRAYRGLRTFRGDSSVATWLHRIAINLARNRYWFYHRRQRHASVSLDAPHGKAAGASLGDLLAADVADPAQESARAEFEELLSECMEELHESHRNILTMLTTHHLSYAQIGSALGIKVGTVKSRIARARRDLRTRLAARCPEFARETGFDDYFLPATSRPLVEAA